MKQDLQKHTLEMKIQLDIVVEVLHSLLRVRVRVNRQVSALSCTPDIPPGLFKDRLLSASVPWRLSTALPGLQGSRLKL